MLGLDPTLEQSSIASKTHMGMALLGLLHLRVDKLCYAQRDGGVHQGGGQQMDGTVLKGERGQVLNQSD